MMSTDKIAKKQDQTLDLRTRVYVGIINIGYLLQNLGFSLDFYA